MRLDVRRAASPVSTLETTSICNDPVLFGGSIARCGSKVSVAAVKPNQPNALPQGQCNGLESAVGHKLTNQRTRGRSAMGRFCCKSRLYRRMSFSHSVRPTGFDPPPLTHSTQRNSYATQCTWHERVVVAQRTTRGVSDFEQGQPEQTRPGRPMDHEAGADQASGCASSVQTASRPSCADVATSRSPRCQRTTGRRPGRAHVCRAGSCAMVLLDSTAV